MSIDILGAFRGEISRGATQVKPTWQVTEHDEMQNLLASLDTVRTVAVTGALAQMPFQTGEFDLVVSTWMLGDFGTADDVMACLGDLARVTSKYAVIQLREADPARARGRKDTLPTARGISQHLASFGLTVVDKRLVKPDLQDGSQVNLVLCERA